MDAIIEYFQSWGHFDFWQVISAFIFLIAIVDPFGNMPITINMQSKGVKIVKMSNGTVRKVLVK